MTLRHTERLSTVLIRRANHLRWKVNGFKGSAKKRFLQLTWKLELSEQDIELKALENKIESLEDEMIELRHEVGHAIHHLTMENGELLDREEEQEIELRKENQANRIRELSSSAASIQSPGTRGKSYKSESEYSESHRRRLRSESCNRSLSWLENHGYVPTMITVINISTGEEETIDLPNGELAQIFGQSGAVNEDEM